MLQKWSHVFPKLFFSPSLYFEPQAWTEHRGRDFVDGMTFVSLLGSKSGEICVFGIQCHQLNISFGLWDPRNYWIYSIDTCESGRLLMPKYCQELS